MLKYIKIRKITSCYGLFVSRQGKCDKNANGCTGDKGYIIALQFPKCFQCNFAGRSFLKHLPGEAHSRCAHFLKHFLFRCDAKS